jgi:outer membrane protein assembly factor BamB
MDGRDPAAVAAAEAPVTIGEHFTVFDGSPGGPAGTWSGFRGPGGANVVAGSLPLAETWPESGPPVVWSVELGEGHAGAAVADGRVYLLDYDEVEKADALRCFSLADGREIWRRWYRVRVKRNHGLSRTVPAVADGVVVTIGPRCHVMAVDATTGDLKWTLDLERDWGTTTPFWYTGQCPLIDDGVAVIAPAGRALLIGVDCASGEILWETPNPDGWQMSHVSVVPMTLAGRRMYVYAALGGMVGVAADGPDRGSPLWQTTLWNHSVLAPSPVLLPGDRLFLTAGYGAGSMVLQVAEAEDGLAVRLEQELRPSEGLASEQQTPVLYRGSLFGIQPKDAGDLREQLVSVDPGDVTRIRWSSGTVRFGLGPYLVAGDRILVLDDDGTLSLIAASAAGFRELARARVIDGVDAWAPMALVGTRLLARDSRRLVCLELGTRS